MGSRQAEEAQRPAVLMSSLDRYVLKRPDPKGVLMGSGAFNETEIRRALLQLAAALDRRNCESPPKRI
jgi:GntR family transcriptional regulator/MocR family aminotransferase